LAGKKIYTAESIFTGNSWLPDHAIVVENNIITDILPSVSLPRNTATEDFPDHFICPAFIDLQIYGAYGKLLAVYPEADSVYKLNEFCNKGGAAWCLPTLATNTPEVFYRSIDAVRDYREKGGEGILGLHLEGPWINPEKRGAHISTLIHPPAIQEVKDILEYGDGIIKMITLAPEVCSREVIELIVSKDIVISAGHSNASYQQALEGFQYGINAITHLYNAMSPLHHREPGLVGAAFDHSTVMASIIPDGHHVDFAAIRIAKQIMKERLYVITDAVTDTKEGYYQHEMAGDKYEAAGILSGSALDMRKAVKNLVNHAGIELGEAIRMCSLYPARLVQMDNICGIIAKGYSARLALLDKDLNTVKLL
jgi:N-acetylglucosamine-6-phosphate deacetylase